MGNLKSFSGINIRYPFRKWHYVVYPAVKEGWTLWSPIGISNSPTLNHKTDFPDVCHSYVLQIFCASGTVYTVPSSLVTARKNTQATEVAVTACGVFPYSPCLCYIHRASEPSLSLQGYTILTLPRASFYIQLLYFLIWQRIQIIETSRWKNTKQSFFW